MYRFAVLCCATLLLGRSSSEQQASAVKGVAVKACTDTDALLLARAVILAAPVIITDEDMYLNDGERLRQFVATYPQFFKQGGSAIRCASVVGPRLVARGIQTYDTLAYEQVMESAPLEIAELSQSVADRINESSADIVEIGQELTWLSRVLPSVARGDMAPFFNTGYDIRNYKRQQAAAVWPAVQQMCAIEGDCRESLSVALSWMARLVDETGLGMVYAMVMMAS